KAAIPAPVPGAAPTSGIPPSVFGVPDLSDILRGLPVPSPDVVTPSGLPSPTIGGGYIPSGPDSPIDLGQKAFGFDRVYQKYGDLHGIDWRLIKAIATVESSENPSALNPNDPSVGMMQVLVQGCYVNGEWLWDKTPRNRFPALGSLWPKTPRQLLDADTNVAVGSAILADNLRVYGLERGVAVFNAWSSRSGSIKNPSYVAKVERAYGRGLA
ncbi:MAG: lytic transglycosylase domain-containing protein, partial [Pseudomonadota bacterium]